MDQTHVRSSPDRKLPMDRTSQSAPPPLKPAPSATTPQQVAAAAAALAASRAASVSAAMRSVLGAQQQAALASAMMNASVNAAASKAAAAKAMVASVPSTKTMTPRSVTTTSVVVMPSSFDGLPVLPSHCSSYVPAVTDDVPRDGAISLFGDKTTRATVRATLVEQYASTNQLDGMTEMTLRMDTELEMLRQQCFAERNARWEFVTPDVFQPVPVQEPVWVAAPYVGPRRQTLLRRKYHEHQREKPNDVSEHDDLVQSLVGIEMVRERAWPPKEFVVKGMTKDRMNTTAPRTSSGKKKPVGMAGIVDEIPVTSLTCSECGTQRSALWRKRPRATAVVTEGVPVEEEDVCLPCFMKTQRRELFDRKAAEKARRAKEEVARAAAEARALKKQQQQMQKKIKKLQQLQQQQHNQIDDGAENETMEDGTVEMVPLKDDEDSFHIKLKLTRRESMTSGVSNVALVPSTASSYDLGEAVDVDDKKKRDKKSKKDKKKKKKKKKKKASDEWDDSDSDDDGATSSVILPSPPQQPMDGFVYADRADATQAAYSDDDAVAETATAESVDSKSKRTSHKRSASTKSSSSKKRKSIDSISDGVVPPSGPPTPASSSRSGRSRAAATTAPVPPAAPQAPTTPSRKRSRPTKKETARERELRALGQYCPVCNMTYEEDDTSPFVCCDSCEMWVHAACDTSLTPVALATLSESNEKYICPLCGGR